MKKLLLFLASLYLCTLTHSQIPAGNVCNGGYFSGTQWCTDSTGRNYRVVVPSNLPVSAMIIVGLHPTQPATIYGGNGMMYTTGWDLTAATAGGFIAIFPEATIDENGKKNWCIDFNGCLPDDVGFIRSLIVKYSSLYETNPKRNYVAGFSMGADMAHKMGRNASDLIAGIASVEGHLWTLPYGSPLPGFPPINPISVIMFCGVKDTLLPCKGGPNVSKTVTVPDSDWDFFFWTNVAKILDTTAIDPIIKIDGTIKSHKVTNGTMLPPIIQPIPYSGSLSGNWTWTNNTIWIASGATTLTINPPPPPVTKITTSVTIEFYSLPFGGHAWYKTSMTDKTLASYQPDIAATWQAGTTTADVILKFFNEHPKP